VEHGGRGQHDERLEGLQRAHERVPGPDVRDVAGPAGDEDERQDEEPPDQEDGLARVPSVFAGEPEGAQQHERVLEHIVAERADQLGDEKRQEPS
jgi:hypothetical protein